MSTVTVPVGQVSGTVRHADGSPTSGATVRAFHRRVGGEVPLGTEAVTDNQGRYVISYQPPTNLEKVDLFVRASDEKKATLAVSGIVIDAGEREVLDLRVADPARRGPSEFSRAADALTPLVAGAALQDLDANDVALLVRQTELS